MIFWGPMTSLGLDFWIFAHVVAALVTTYYIHFMDREKAP